DLAEDARRRRANGNFVELGNKTSSSFHRQESPPVRFCLVPAGLFLKAHAEWNIGGGHLPDADHGFLLACRNALPSKPAVYFPPSMAKTPLTKTYRTPVAYWWGLSKVAVSR